MIPSICTSLIYSGEEERVKNLSAVCHLLAEFPVMAVMTYMNKEFRR